MCDSLVGIFNYLLGFGTGGLFAYVLLANNTYNVNLNPSSNISVSLWLTLTATDTTIRNPIELSAASDELYFIL